MRSVSASSLLYASQTLVLLSDFDFNVASSFGFVLIDWDVDLDLVTDFDFCFKPDLDFIFALNLDIKLDPLLLLPFLVVAIVEW